MISETTPKQQQITDNLEQLLQALPPDVLQAIEAQLLMRNYEGFIR